MATFHPARFRRPLATSRKRTPPFDPMINILRKNSKALWIVIAILCIPFVFYFSNADIGAIGSNEFGRLYDEPISHIEAQRQTRFFNLARELGMFDFLQDLVTGAKTENEAYTEFTWNRLILRHEAERLGIAPSSGEIAGVVRNLQSFRGASGFDINKYNEFTQSVLPAMGFNEAHIEELAVDQLALARLKKLVGSGIQIPDAESRENYERAHGKLSLSVVRVNSEGMGQDLPVTDEEIAKYHETNKAQLNSEEKRKISFVTFGLNEEQKKLTGKERVEALQKVADNANDFNQALLEKDAQFEQVAEKFQLPPQTTAEFTKSKPDPLLTANPQLTDAAFQLTTEQPNSDPIQGGDSFYVLHLAGLEPARPLTLEEAKPKIVESIKSQRVREMVTARGAEVAQKVREGLKSGLPIEAALQQTGLPVEKIPPFALADRQPMPTEPDKAPEPQAADLPMIKGAVSELAPGEVSEFIPTASGGVVAVVEKRDKPEAAVYEAGKASFEARILDNRRDAALQDWLRERRREAGVRDKVEPTIEATAG